MSDAPIINDRPYHPGKEKPTKADVYERRLEDGRTFLSFYDGREWMIGAPSLAQALKQHITSPLQTYAEWREIK